MPKSPAAFMSYARFDDRHDGQITKFREGLSDRAITRLLTGVT